jgi:hypothetical protein
VNIYLAAGIGVAVWGAIFVFLMVTIAIEADIARRWDEQWVLGWEARTGRPVDDLLDRLSNQISRWRMARKFAMVWLVIGVIVMVGVAGIQYRMTLLSADGFKTLLLVGVALLGLLLLPLTVGCEIGLNLVEGMRRHLRMTLGEKVVIHSRRELSGMPRLHAEKKKDKKAAK